MSNTTKTPFFKRHAVVWTAIMFAFLGLCTLGILLHMQSRKEKPTEQLIEQTVKETIYQMQLTAPTDSTTID